MHQSFNWQAWGALALVVVFLFCVTIGHELTKPPLGLANGTYISPCCEPIIVSNGKLIYRSKTHDLDLERMKFGLTGFLKDDLDGRPSNMPIATVLSFSGEGPERHFDTLLDGHERTFWRIRTAGDRDK